MRILGEQRLVYIQMKNLGYGLLELEWCGQWTLYQWKWYKQHIANISDNSCYHHQCIANWTAVIMLQVLIGHSGEKRCEKWKTRRAVSVVTLKMHRSIDRIFAFSSGLCSWINEDSRICSCRQLLSLPMTSGLWKSTRWCGLACKCVHTEELSDVRCSSIRFIKLRYICLMYEAPHERVSLYTL